VLLLFRAAEARAGGGPCEVLAFFTEWTKLVHMKQVNVHQAKTQLSQLLADVEAGEVIVIARAGKPIARLTAEPVERTVLRQPGAMKGEFVWDEEAWKAGDAEILQMFEDSINAPLSPPADDAAS
jgi:prevent-host-death family protein